MKGRLTITLVGLALSAIILAAIMLPAWADKGILFLAGVILIHVIFATSFNYVFGLAGLLSFGHAAFFASGAYVTGLLLQRYDGVPFVLALAAGAAAGTLAACAVALIALRRAAGVYLAILTLALAELLHIVISRSSVLGREDGLTGIKRPTLGLGPGAVDLSKGDTIYYFILVCTILFIGVMWILWNNQLGRSLAAIRQDPGRARFLGIDVHRTRFLAFAISGFGAGFAGALYAPLAQLLTPDLAHWTHSALPILFSLLGGASQFFGPTLGVVLFMGLEHATRNLVGVSEIIIGSTLLVIVLGLPGGVLGTLRSRLQARSAAADLE